jgi:hypothetical protein
MVSAGSLKKDGHSRSHLFIVCLASQLACNSTSSAAISQSAKTVFGCVKQGGISME